MRVARWLLAGALALTLGVVGVPDSGAPPATTRTPTAPTASTSLYEGTSAERFAEGAAGIAPPAAEVVPDGYIAGYTLATRDITAKEVAEALDDARAALIATRLDRRMLLDHDPQPFIETLARLYWYAWFDPYMPELREYDAYEVTEFAYLATKLAPGVLLAAEPRVAGRITFSAGTSKRGGAPRNAPWRVLRIVTRFVWVYALEVPGNGVRIVVIRNEVSWHVPTDARLDCCQSNVGLHHAVAEVRAWGADCDLYLRRGLIRPDSSSDFSDDVFDVDRPIESLGGCQPERDCSLPVVASSCAVLGE
jgi:hypothetical protein